MTSKTTRTRGVKPGRNRQTIGSKTVKYGKVFGQASSAYEEHRETVIPTTITAKDIEITGVGSADLQSVIIKEADMHITKQLSETTAYNDVHIQVINKRKGWFAPRLRGDPARDAIRTLMATNVPGDILPNVANVVGAGAQTLSHLTTLANLSTMAHPVLAVAQVLLSRFTTGAVYSNTTQEITREEHVPVQSRVEVGILSVNNDRTHLEGIWNVDKASIDTGTLTTHSPQHTMSQQEKTEGWSVSFSPAAVLGAIVLPVGALSSAIAAMPTITVQRGKEHAVSEENVLMEFSANELFIRCNDAIFSGAQIRAKVVDAIVTGKVTVESLANMFDSDDEQSQVGVSLAAIAGMVHDVPVDKSVLEHSAGAVPHVRIANQTEITKQVDHIASLVGTERFFLKVGEMLYNKGAEIGLRKEGIVTKSDDERIEAERILNEPVDEVHHHSERVINPAIGEIVAMMGQIDEFKRIRARVKQAAISEKLKPADVDKLDNDVKKFLDDPDVKDSLDKLETAEEKLNAVTVQLAELEVGSENVSPSTVEGNVSSSTLEGSVPSSIGGEIIPHGSAIKSGAQAVLSPEYTTLEANKDSLAYEVFKQVTTFRQHSEEFARKHPIWAKIGRWALQGIGYLGLAGIVKAGIKLGGKKMLALFGSQVLSQEVIAAVIENGTDALVDHAISYASDEQEAAEFAETAVWAVEATLAGAAVVGVAGLIKDKAAVSNKLQATKVNVSSAAKAKFSQKQELRRKSIDRLSSIADEKAAQLDRGQYNPRVIESMLKVNNPEAEISSTTLPRENHPNVKLTGAKHPESGIVFDNRGFPIFDKYIKHEVQITGDLKNMDKKAHMRAATRQLRSDIEAGIVDKNIRESQNKGPKLKAIMAAQMAE